jgi:hypothetical protein
MTQADRSGGPAAPPDRPFAEASDDGEQTDPIARCRTPASRAAGLAIERSEKTETASFHVGRPMVPPWPEVAREGPVLHLCSHHDGAGEADDHGCLGAVQRIACRSRPRGRGRMADGGRLSLRTGGSPLACSSKRDRSDRAPGSSATGTGLRDRVGVRRRGWCGWTDAPAPGRDGLVGDRASGEEPWADRGPRWTSPPEAVDDPCHWPSSRRACPILADDRVAGFRHAEMDQTDDDPDDGLCLCEFPGVRSCSRCPRRIFRLRLVPRADRSPALPPMAQ